MGRGGWPPTKGDALLSREESKGNALSGEYEAAEEEHPLDGSAAGLSKGLVTRAQALKLAGLGAAGFLFASVLSDEANARRRKKRRRKKKVQVTSPLPLIVVPGGPTLVSVLNPGSTPLTISEVKVLDSDGSVIRTVDVADVTIPANGGLGVVTIDEPLVDAEGLRLIDGRVSP
jgi:hypothetical protein